MNEITYTRVGDYLLPNIVLNEPPNAPPLGKYGCMRREFLREHRPILFSELVLTERLFPHLRDMDEIARERHKCGVPEEIILNELVYE